MIPIGRLISPLVFIEDKVIQILVFSVVQNCICYVFYSVSPRPSDGFFRLVVAVGRQRVVLIIKPQMLAYSQGF
jgi:hypothetical protein